MEHSPSTDASSAATSLSFAGKSKKMDDTSSVDTAELLRSIRQNERPSVSIENSSLIDAVAIGDVKQPYYKKTYACENVSDNLPAEVAFPNLIEINVAVATGTRVDPHLAERCDDEFILPEQSFSSDDENSDLDENEDTHYMEVTTTGTVSMEQRYVNNPMDTKSKKFLHEDGSVKASSGSHKHGNLNKSAQLKTNENPFDCNQHNLALANESNLNTMQRTSRSRNEIENHPKRYYSTIDEEMDEENIDNFSSDDEYVQASGFGEVTKVFLEQRQRLNRFDHFASRGDTKSLVRKCASTVVDPIVPECHLSSFSGTTHNIKSGSPTSCTNGKTCFYLDSMHCTDSTTLAFKNCKSMAEQNFQASNRKFPPDHSKENKNQPRRIRDPSSRPKSVVNQSSNLTSAKPFRECTNHVASINKVPDLVAGSTATTTGERNDVFGGSGVGAGSYQIHKRSCPETQTMAEDIFSSEVGSNPDKIVLATKRHPVSKSKTFKRKNAKYEDKSEGKRAYRSGGKRGKWGWKNKAKQTTGDKRNTSSQQRQRRVTSSWVGNTDDPQLRHVGGAEMSF